MSNGSHGGNAKATGSGFESTGDPDMDAALWMALNIIPFEPDKCVAASPQPSAATNASDLIPESAPAPPPSLEQEGLPSCSVAPPCSNDSLSVSVELDPLAVLGPKEWMPRYEPVGVIISATHILRCSLPWEFFFPTLREERQKREATEFSLHMDLKRTRFLAAWNAEGDAN